MSSSGSVKNSVAMSLYCDGPHWKRTQRSGCCVHWSDGGWQVKRNGRANDKQDGSSTAHHSIQHTQEATMTQIQQPSLLTL